MCIVPDNKSPVEKTHAMSRPGSAMCGVMQSVLCSCRVAQKREKKEYIKPTDTPVVRCDVTCITTTNGDRTTQEHYLSALRSRVPLRFRPPRAPPLFPTHRPHLFTRLTYPSPASPTAQCHLISKGRKRKEHGKEGLAVAAGPAPYGWARVDRRHGGSPRRGQTGKHLHN